MIEYSPDFFQLCYHNTDTRIMLGDHVTFSKWFGLVKVDSRVCYVPGVSPPHTAMADTENSSLWAITDGPNDIIQMLYVANDRSVSKRIKFVSRARDNYTGLQGSESVL